MSEYNNDDTLETLIDLHGFIAEIGNGYWVKIEARRVAQDLTKPHGIKYSLTLHNIRGERILGYDNAHAVPSKPGIKTHDHMHKSGKIVSYSYTEAAKLLEDFWKDVEQILGKEA
jgi:hypothetical protein